MTAREEIEAILKAGSTAVRENWEVEAEVLVTRAGVQAILALADRIDELDRLTHGGRSSEDYFALRRLGR